VPFSDLAEEDLPMQRGPLTSKPVIISFLVLQLIPLVIFPASSYSLTSQEWWLPLLLAIMVLIADFSLILRRSQNPWPWNLMGFAQGFNVISRLMMIWPHATINRAGVQVINTSYITITVASMIMSAALLWYLEQPAVRMNMGR
jgi:hypothetical protein